MTCFFLYIIKTVCMLSRRNMIKSQHKRYMRNLHLGCTFKIYKRREKYG